MCDYMGSFYIQVSFMKLNTHRTEIDSSLVIDLSCFKAENTSSSGTDSDLSIVRSRLDASPECLLLLPFAEHVVKS
jgi:hypothetical protein